MRRQLKEIQYSNKKPENAYFARHDLHGSKINFSNFNFALLPGTCLLFSPTLLLILLEYQDVPLSFKFE